MQRCSVGPSVKAPGFAVTVAFAGVPVALVITSPSVGAMRYPPTVDPVSFTFHIPALRTARPFPAIVEPGFTRTWKVHAVPGKLMPPDPSTTQPLQPPGKTGDPVTDDVESVPARPTPGANSVQPVVLL